MRKLIPLLLALALLVSCASAPKYTSYAAIKGVSCPQAEFAADEIITALSNASIGISDENPQWIIRFADIKTSLGEQTYHV